MNTVLDVIANRRSVRAYDERPIPLEVRDQLLEATLRAPTAGNLMLYSIIEVNHPAAKETLAETCDHQPFIARAPLVWLFLADYQRWIDGFVLAGIEDACRQKGESMQKPEEADLFLACCDALVAAQTAVIAAESLGLGSCYIGDIVENYETHRDLFHLPPYTFPIAMLCFGYPTDQQKKRRQTERLDPQYVVFEDRYRRMEKGDFAAMYEPANVAERVYNRKFTADFAREMRRSVRVMLQNWKEQ